MKQNGKLSLFRRFKNWNQFYDELIHRILAVLFIVSCVIICVTLNNKYGHELNIYDESDYKYLTSILYTILDEDTKSLKLDYIPDNVNIEGTTFSSSGSAFKCTLTNRTRLVPSPFITVNISEDFTVKVTHYTESEFRSSAKGEFVMFCIAYCVLCLFVGYFSFWLIKFLIYIFCILYDWADNFIRKFNKS